LRLCRENAAMSDVVPPSVGAADVAASVGEPAKVSLDSKP